MLDRKVVAEHLLREDPLFRDGEYTLYYDVRVDSLNRKGRLLRQGQPEERVDFLMCKGSHVVLGICCHARSERLFRDRTPGLNFVTLEDDTLPFEYEDEEPSQASLRWLCVDIRERLAERVQRTGLMTHRRRTLEGEPPEATGYELLPLPVSDAVPRLKKTQELETLLLRHRLCARDGEATLFGAEHGLFFRCGLDGQGNLRLEPMSTANRFRGLREELGLEPISREKRRVSLPERLERMAQGLPGDDRGAVAALEGLLNATLEELYLEKSGALDQLHTLLARPEWERPPAIHTWRDVLELAQELWNGFGPDERTDSSAQRRGRGLFEELMLLLAEPFLMPKAIAGTPRPAKQGRRSLSQRLKELPGEPWRRYPIFRMPLSQYYRAASCLTGSGYGLWLYRREMLPLFQGDERPESAFHLMILAQHCRNLRDDPEIGDWDETFPLLYHLLVAPVIGGELT